MVYYLHYAMSRFSLTILVLSVIFHCTLSLKVATYNLWNIMFNWEVRKMRVIEMIETINPDVIAFQEVRMDSSSVRSQLLELQEKLIDFNWMVVQPANDVQKPKHTYWNGWEREGIGILSKLPILKSTTISIPYMSGPDTNQRIALHAMIGYSEDSAIHVLTVHFSYDRQQQCNNAARILHYISEKELENVVLLGDFNTYQDFEWPLEVFTDTEIRPENSCFDMVRADAKGPNTILADVWSVHAADKLSGFTFSNMPTPGYESRPDRILVSKSFKILSCNLHGNGNFYKKKYKTLIFWHRFQRVIKSAYEAFQGFSGYSCTQDCGPHGSCRCGVCVNIGNQKDCLLIDCSECNSFMFLLFILLTLFACLLSSVTVLALILFLFSRISVRTFHCLYSVKLYFNTRAYSRLRILYRFFPFIKAPLPFLLVCIVTNLVFYTVITFIFSGTLQTIFRVMAEEFYPSDHLMISSQLWIPNKES
ncbi:Hypothetical predicted protein [Octopus vulgaris]|uniref:Uncharacterized protein n=4 Tax=Octopus TaxID=6643 RepID=A0AA36AU81_OCTVU|nr:uncharacterized protein LOC115210364 [Octopus sinensis]CAI9721317.1 Hypothetical predicted protein [Octopus vulgaris]